MKDVVKICLLLAMNIGVVLAQALDTVWTRRYNSQANNDDKAQYCAVDNSGYLYVTGYCWNGANYDYLTIKYSRATGVFEENGFNPWDSNLRMWQGFPTQSAGIQPSTYDLCGRRECNSAFTM
ncbi:MAG: hypothetical protein KA126_05265 [Candidatus Hydrothermae bacterium]|nr:hypothetical protein [Candidatus Hydrothermae bacterium]HOK22836.1 hypothetical protein [Candidatus Hydrothermia bacterium]HOL23545.1 hypothetical protein [Candidatus Hydrothermia bacterium]